MTPLWTTHTLTKFMLFIKGMVFYLCLLKKLHVATLEPFLHLTSSVLYILGCTYKGKSYTHGDLFRDGCSQCRCLYGNLTCTQQENVTCKQFMCGVDYQNGLYSERLRYSFKLNSYLFDLQKMMCPFASNNVSHCIRCWQLYGMLLYESVSCVCLCLSDVLYICMHKCCIVHMF